MKKSNKMFYGMLSLGLLIGYVPYAVMHFAFGLPMFPFFLFSICVLCCCLALGYVWGTMERKNEYRKKA